MIFRVSNEFTGRVCQEDGGIFMTFSVVLGAGQIGSEVARQLAAGDTQVTVATRTGRSRVVGEHISNSVVDAADADSLADALVGADTVFVAVNWPYQQWHEQWLPTIESIIDACEQTETSLVLAGNLYGYGRVSIPMTEQMPLNAAEPKGTLRTLVWDRVRQATDAGRIRGTEIRASDYFGPGVTDSAHLGDRFFVPIMRSEGAKVVGDPAAVHSWSFVPDIARTMIAASRSDDSWGKPWLVPNGEPLGRSFIAKQVNMLARSSGTVAGIPSPALKAAGLVNPMLRELAKVEYQFTSPFVTDSTYTEQVLGVTPTAWGDALAQTVAYWRDRVSTF